MKTSFIIFIVFTYLSIFYFAGVAEYSAPINSTVVGNLQSLGQPVGTNFGVGLTSMIVLVWDWMKTLIQMIFLWNGTLWVGNWLYFYYYVCLPVCIGVVASIVMVMRGVHAS